MSQLVRLAYRIRLKLIVYKRQNGSRLVSPFWTRLAPQEEAAKSTPWQMVHDEFLKRGWKKAARKKCKRSKVHGNVGFEVPDWDSLLARVAVKNKLHTFDKTICGCSSQDVCP